MSIFLAMANDLIKSYSWNNVFLFFSTKSKKSLDKRKKVELCTDTYDWYSCLEYQYIEHDDKESNEHIFSNGKWFDQKLFLK